LAGLETPVPDAKGQGDNRLLIDLWDDLGPWIVLALLPLAALSFRRGLLCLAFVVLLPLPENAYALDWQDLWLTRDQQAAEAYQRKEYKRAAELFENPDWKAAAQYEADLQVEGEMKTPKTAVGFYNQGNVLAKSNRLEEAIQAYDKALEMKPNFEDAKFNKKIVEDELKRRKQQNQQNQQNQQRSGPQRQDEMKDRKQDPQESEQSQSQSDDGRQSEQKEQNSEPEHGENSLEKSEAGKEKEAERAAEEEKQAEAQPSEETAGEAKKEGQKPDSPERNEASAQAMQPVDETAQANQQWLNRIPDDPGGLLKRKFKYQYGLRQQRSDRQ
jgi:Ca-activated chloride channel family protein